MGGNANVYVVVAVHPAASLAITVYVPEHRFRKLLEVEVVESVKVKGELFTIGYK